MTASPQQQRILVYAQHLSGVGHYVRTFEIARTLAIHHQVYWIEGGIPVPHAACPALNTIELPRIRRGADGLLHGLDSTQNITRLMHERAAKLLEIIESIRPDIFLIEYFPFSKWELQDELLPAIAAVHKQGGKVLCSVRDVVRKTRFETTPDKQYTTQVCTLLNRYFDAVLVHADPTVTRLEEHFPAIAGIQPPIYYTGIVSEKLTTSPDTAATIAAMTEEHPFVLTSVGGGIGGQILLEQVITAWQETDVANERRLVVCTGLGWSEVLMKQLQRQADKRIVLLPFRNDFLHWLAAADLSISQCGYNTAANLLETGTPAIVSPNMAMSDQLFRAQRLAERGLVALFCAEKQEKSELIHTIERLLNQKRSAYTHRIDLNGAEQTRQLIERFNPHPSSRREAK